MPLDTLEELRLLYNLQSGNAKLLQIILFGQQELNAKLDRLLSLEGKIKELEAKIDGKVSLAAPKHATRDAVLLPEIDEGIIGYALKKGKVCAEQVQMKFKYKGSNAASSRLNRLVKEGLLRKVQVGRKVFFLPIS